MSEAATMRAEMRDSERKFYSRMAIALVVVVLLGFGPSFYLRGIVPPYPRPNPTLPPSVMLHGVLLTLWILAFVAQTQLVAARQTKLHMKLGAATLVLALAIIPMMYLIAVWQVGRANAPPFTTPLEWTIVPLSVIPVYAILLWNGWRRRREAQWHKRLMLCATIVVVLGPSFGRMPIAPPTLAGFTFQHTLGLVLFIPLMLWDRRSQGRVHAATWMGFGLAIVMIAVPTLFLGIGDWAAVARHLPGVG